MYDWNQRFNSGGAWSRLCSFPYPLTWGRRTYSWTYRQESAGLLLPVHDHLEHRIRLIVDSPLRQLVSGR